jgi:hypothetical protein
MKNNIKYILIITILLGGLLLHTKVGLAACLDKNNIANNIVIIKIYFILFFISKILLLSLYLLFEKFCLCCLFGALG